jgi:membrane-bound serine protease (ClpP class)
MVRARSFMKHRSDPVHRPTAGRSLTAVPALAAIFIIALSLVLTGLLPPSAAAPQADAASTTLPSARDAGPPSEIWVTEARGIIDPALATFLVKTMDDAAGAGAGALVVRLDNPGGLDSAMRDIIQAQLDCPIPVVFYVAPQGARAASAGLYILMGADVAAMSPSTNLGAATPVSLGQEMDETMQAKVTNDAAAYIRGLASTPGRHADGAERAVREAVSLPAEEALEQGVIGSSPPIY